MFALLSGTGLVALVGWSLYSAAQQGQVRAELDARARARDLGQALRAALRSPATLEITDAADRFTVQDGRVLVPDAVGWVQLQPRRSRDPVVRERLQLAQRAEFGDGDRAAARAHFDEDQRFAVFHHQVDFATAKTDVGRDETQSGAFEVAPAKRFLPLSLSPAVRHR